MYRAATAFGHSELIRQDRLVIVNKILKLEAAKTKLLADQTAKS